MTTDRTETGGYRTEGERYALFVLVGIVAATLAMFAAFIGRSDAGMTDQTRATATPRRKRVALARFPSAKAAGQAATFLYNAGAISYAEMDDRIRQARA